MFFSISDGSVNSRSRKIHAQKQVLELYRITFHLSPTYVVNLCLRPIHIFSREIMLKLTSLQSRKIGKISEPNLPLVSTIHQSNLPKLISHKGFLLLQVVFVFLKSKIFMMNTFSWNTPKATKPSVPIF